MGIVKFEGKGNRHVKHSMLFSQWSLRSYIYTMAVLGPFADPSNSHCETLKSSLLPSLFSLSEDLFEL